MAFLLKERQSDRLVDPMTRVKTWEISPAELHPRFVDDPKKVVSHFEQIAQTSSRHYWAVSQFRSSQDATTSSKQSDAAHAWEQPPMWGSPPTNTHYADLLVFLNKIESFHVAQVSRLEANRKANTHTCLDTETIKQSWSEALQSVYNDALGGGHIGKTAIGLPTPKQKVGEEEFNSEYGRIGWWKGPHATREAQNEVRQFWKSAGAAGAEWLVKRIAKETHGDILEGVANLLADIGPASIIPVVRELDAEPTRDQAEVLLKSLGWIEADHDAAVICPKGLETTLEKYLTHSDADIRAAAWARPVSSPTSEYERCSECDDIASSIPTSAKPLTKPSENENEREPSSRLWRSVKKNRWVDKSPESPADVDSAAKDFKLRENEEYLSFFGVTSDEEGRKVAAAFKAVQPTRCDDVDFMLFPREFLTDAGITLIYKPLDGAPDILDRNHLGTVGPLHQPGDSFIKRLLVAESVKIIRMKKAEIVEVAKLLVEEYPDFRRHLGDDWRKHVLTDREPGGD